MDGMLSTSVTAFKLLGESVMDSLMLKSYGSFLQENVNVSVVVRFSVALVKHRGHKQLWGRKGSLQPATLLMASHFIHHSRQEAGGKSRCRAPRRIALFACRAHVLRAPRTTKPTGGTTQSVALPC